MRKMITILFIFIGFLNILFADALEDELKKFEQSSNMNSFDIVDNYAKLTLTYDAIGTNVFEEGKKFMINNANTKIGLASTKNKKIEKGIDELSKSFYKRWKKSMFKVGKQKTMRGMLNILAENDDKFKDLKLAMKNNDLTIKKYNSVIEDVNKATDKYASKGIIPRGLSTIGLISSIYGLTKDGLSIKKEGVLGVLKTANSAYGVLDASIAVSSAYNLKFAQTAFAKSLSGSGLSKFNITLSLIQLQGVVFQVLRDAQLNKIFNSKINNFAKIEKDANNDISLLNQYLFEHNSKDINFDGFLRNSNLRIFSFYRQEGLTKLKTIYTEYSKDIQTIKFNFGKNNFSELDKYEKTLLMFFSIKNFYMNKAYTIITDLQNLGKEGASFSNIVLGVQTLGSGWDVFKNAGDIAIKLSKLSPKLDNSMDFFLATDFFHRFNYKLSERGKLIEEAKKQLAQKLYDNEHALNNSYEKKIPIGVAGNMVSFNYNASNRIDKCISRYNFHNGLNYIVSKDFELLPSHEGYLNNQEFENFGYGSNSDKKITIKEALYFIDLYSNEILKTINFNKRYKIFKLSPKGKFILKNIYKHKWYKSFNNLGLEKYIKRQYIQMQGSIIGLTKNDMNNLDKCLIGYKAINLLDRYEKTLYYYYNLSREEN